jgi:hypothetical protein
MVLISLGWWKDVFNGVYSLDPFPLILFPGLGISYPEYNLS